VVCTDNVDLLLQNICTVKNAVALMVMSKKVCLECSAEKLSTADPPGVSVHASCFCLLAEELV
jgi:hypothetical protein